MIARNRGYGYDANGNMTNDGQFAYVLDEADRLTEVRKGNEVVMTCKYDGLGRRRERVLLESGTGVPPVYSTNRYIYDGWLVVAVLDGSTNILETYTHGPDLSGTLDGAGGIGGILHVSTPLLGGAGGGYFFHYDGNGNVIACTDTNQSLVASLEYGPFGTVLTRSGSYTPRYQFSTKEYDEPVRLNYYGYRFYSPSMGRWLNRDPIGDLGGQNIYGVVSNDPVNSTDMLGLYGCTQSEKPIGPLKKDCKQIASIVVWEKQFSSFQGRTYKCDCYCAKYEHKREKCVFEQEHEVHIHCEFKDPCSSHPIVFDYTYNYLKSWSQIIVTQKVYMDQTSSSWFASSRAACDLGCIGYCSSLSP